MSGSPATVGADAGEDAAGGPASVSIAAMFGVTACRASRGGRVRRRRRGGRRSRGGVGRSPRRVQLHEPGAFVLPVSALSFRRGTPAAEVQSRRLRLVEKRRDRGGDRFRAGWIAQDSERPERVVQEN